MRRSIIGCAIVLCFFSPSLFAGDVRVTVRKAGGEEIQLVKTERYGRYSCHRRQKRIREKEAGTQGHRGSDCETQGSRRQHRLGRRHPASQLDCDYRLGRRHPTVQLDCD